MVDQASSVVPAGGCGGSHEVSVETVAVIQVFEPILSRLSKIASAIRGRGSAPALLADMLRDGRGEVVFTAVGEHSIQGREHISLGFVAATGGGGRVIGEEHACVRAKVVRP